MSKSNEKHWKDCGYVSISKSGQVLSIVVKNKRYIANLDEICLVLDGTKQFAQILEYVGDA